MRPSDRGGPRAVGDGAGMIAPQPRCAARVENPRIMPMVMDKAILADEGVAKRLLRTDADTPAAAQPSA